MVKAKKKKKIGVIETCKKALGYKDPRTGFKPLLTPLTRSEGYVKEVEGVAHDDKVKRTIDQMEIDERLDEINDLAILARLFPEDMTEYHDRRERVKEKLSSVTKRGDRDEKKTGQVPKPLGTNLKPVSELLQAERGMLTMEV